MQIFALLPLLAAFLAVSPVSGHALAVTPDKCGAESVVSEHFIGRDNNVKVLVSRCGAHATVEKRAPSDTNVCNTDCATQCEGVNASDVPLKEDCQVIADALRYDELNRGGTFVKTNAQGEEGDTVTMQYKTCKTSFQNQATTELTFCRANWVNLIDAVYDICGVGQCNAADSRWAVSVAHQ